LPRPSDSTYVPDCSNGYTGVEILERRPHANAAGKAFQAWRALLAALLRLNRDRLVAAAKSEEERRWLEERAVPRVPTTRMRQLSLMLEIGYDYLSLWTEIALNLHDYWISGLDVVDLTTEIARRV
jgi:hypothetical protein